MESLLKIAAATDYLKNIKPILPRKPSIRSTFDVYLREDRLIYVKEPCSAEDMQGAFFLHVVPADASDLPEHRKRYGFDNLGDFRFRDYSFPLNEGCVAQRVLPDYPITRIRTGQYTDEGIVWEGDFHHPTPTYIAGIERMIEEIIHSSDAELVLREYFDVYADKTRLTFVRNQCAAADIGPQFFVHVFPVDVDDLPAHRQQHGFDNLDFRFNDHGIRSAERCVARRELPDYAITRIRTGQYLVNEDGSYTHLWEREIRFD